jgi:trehalose/maltose hydrolase-like predicted phosphorylase
MHLRILLTILSFSILSLAAASSDTFDWTLSVTTLNQSSFTAQPYVANGYIGSRLPAVGVGYQEFQANQSNPEELGQGWPIFGPRVTATNVAGFFDVQNSTLGTNFPQTGGEQVISLLPTWTSLFLTLEKNGKQVTFGPGVANDTVTDYKQTMSIRDGIVTTSLKWTPDGFESVSINYTVLAHQSRINVGMMKLQVHGLKSGTQAFITDVLDGQGAARTQAHKSGQIKSDVSMIYSSVQPHWINNVTAWMYSAFQSDDSHQLTNVSIPSSVNQYIGGDDPATATQSYSFNTSSISVWKAVGIATSDAFAPHEKNVAHTAARAARALGWKSLVKEHRKAWSDIRDNGGDIILHGTDEMNMKLQTQARASIFHLLTNARKGSEGPGLGDNSIAPSGLTSDSYAGSIFWDAETFMAPALLVLYPEYVESMLAYRFKRPWQLIENAQEHQRPGAIYPWVSARYQNATGVGPTYTYEYHLNNDIALLHWQYYQHTHNKTFLEKQAYPVMHRVASFWAAQVVKENDGLYHALNMTDPDEYANFVDDGAFTNAGIATILDSTISAARILGKEHEIAANWTEIAQKITIRQSNVSQVTLEYDGFNGTTEVKQADVPLLIYPLEFAKQYPEKEPSPSADLEYHAGATSSNGPGMTYSIYGIAAAELATSGCESYTRLLQAGLPYEREYAQFSEQVVDEYADNGGTNPAFTFLTAHGGLLQLYTHGFTGHRSRTDRLYLDPSLPPQLGPKITVKGVRYGDSTVDIDIGLDKTTIFHRSGGSLKVEIGERNADAGNHTLSVGGSLQVATTSTQFMGKNLAQCRSITSSQDAMGGNYLPGAVDGSNATYFAPATDAPTEIVMDLYEKHPIHKVRVDFLNPPANTVSVFTSNDNHTYTSRAANVSVNITSPYDPSTAALVRVPLLNTTIIPIKSKEGGSVNARYVKLVVEGTYQNEGAGTGSHIGEIIVT